MPGGFSSGFGAGFSGQLQVVQFGDISKTFDRALQQVLSNYFDGQSHTIGQVVLGFETAEVDFGFQYFDNNLPDETVQVIFLGGSTGKIQKQKVKDPFGTRPFAYEQWAQSDRKVFVRVRLGKDLGAAERRCKDAWGQLEGVFRSQQRAFAMRGIHLPQLDPNPAFIRDLYALVYWSYFSCSLRSTYSQDT